MDIVERLRDMQNKKYSPYWCTWVQRQCNEAATEIEQLRLAEEGAKEAFETVVQDKRDLEAQCKRLHQLLDSAHDQIRRLVHAA